MPTREAVAPRRRPAHDVFGRGFLPEGEVHGFVFLALTVEIASGGEHLVEDATAEATVGLEIFLILAEVEIYATVALVGIPFVENLFHEFDLLDDVAAGEWLDAGTEDVELVHRRMVAVGVVLSHLHRFELFEPGFLCNLVLTLVGIVFEVSHVGDVADVAHLVADMEQVAVEYVEGYGGTGMAEVSVAIDGGATYVHSDTAFVDGTEKLFLMG